MEVGIHHDVNVSTVFVQGEDGREYLDTLNNFNLDYGQSLPMPPVGINERLYERGIRHALLTNNNVVDGGPVIWPDGDAIISNIDNIIAAKKRRQGTSIRNITR